MSDPSSRSPRAVHLLRAILVLVLTGGLLGVTPAGAAPGTSLTGCADGPTGRCPTWQVEYDDPSITPPRRSDQFVTGVAAGEDLLVVTMKNVGLDPADPYGATGSWLVMGYDLDTGAVAWRAERRERTYDVPLAVALSPDGATAYVTGASYDAFSVAATDSRAVTVAYDTATGRELWSAQWDDRPDGRDTPKTIAVSPDGRSVYVGGITTSAEGDLDYLVLAYDTGRGRELWSTTYAGPGGDDALYDLAVDPAGHQVYVTGSSLSTVQYDADYLTLGIGTDRGKRGRVVWTSRFDGVGMNRSDRAGALAVAGDGTVLVTGDSYVPRADGGDGYDATTVAYDRSGRQLWTNSYGGPGSGVAFDAGRDLTVLEDRVVVTAQSAGATADDGLDAATVGYDLATGAQLWLRREDQPRTSELPMAIAAAGGEGLAVLASTSRPVVRYTALESIRLRAYDVATGAEAWAATVSSEAGSATSAETVAVSPGGVVAVSGLVTRSQVPTGAPSQNRYDAIVATFAPR